MSEQPGRPAFPGWDDLPEVVDDAPVVYTSGPADSVLEELDRPQPDLGAARAAEPPPLREAITLSSEFEVQGNLEDVKPLRIGGWVVLVTKDGVRELLTVRAVDGDGRLIATGTAGEFRNDVREAGLGRGWCGFDLDVSLGAMDGVREVVLEVSTDRGWVEVSRRKVALAPAERPLSPGSLLAGFAEAGTSEAVIGSSGLRVGRVIWLQAARSVIGRVRVSLQLVPGPQDEKRIPVVRLEPLGDESGRVDLRLHLGPHATRVAGEWIAVRVYPRSGSQQPVRVNLLDHRGRIGLGDFVVRSHQWSTLHVRVPGHACEESDLEGEDDTLWLELTLDGGSPVDVASPELDPRELTDPFECLHVQTQRTVLESVDERPVAASGPFSVVIPFFGKAAYTAACVSSVLSCSWSTPEVVLVDDGSPSFSSIDRLLAGFEGVRVVRAARNRGYTASVNTGVAAATHERVVILNNDTRVTPGWDAPLLEALDDPDVFASGPLSNAASYQSVPELRAEGGWAINTLPAGVTPVALARVLRERFEGTRLSLAVLNGFCYAVRKQGFLSLGGLDEAAFPHGYGEEVDLMMRAQAAGLRSVVCPSSFVYHYKSITFGERRAGLSKQGTAVVQQRWGGQLSSAVQRMDADPDFDAVRGEIRGLIAALGAEAARG